MPITPAVFSPSLAPNCVDLLGTYDKMPRLGRPNLHWEQVDSLSSGAHRKYPRIGVNLIVEYTVGGRTLRRRANTLGGGGLFLAGVAEEAPGTEVSLRFRPAKHLHPINARGVIRYHIPGKGTAIEFTELDPADRQVLLKLILRKRGERRRYPRASLVTQVEFQGLTTLANSRDVSVGGMFLETSEPPPAESQVNLRFNIDDGGGIIIARAKVLYCVAKLGIGVEFTGLSPADRERIAAYIGKAPKGPVAEPVAAQPQK